ncbi:hypothetical protein [Campylobacter sp. RM16187]|uniref:hypothetical protein n=1 Tax=Campylobacter sp. RM16187 TaxID=1660063 RepID=UPI0021B6CD75|nr:hypothetical protein [Campylobacter sp. RM16187]QKG30316.1 hypothetical protein CDOMF_b018 [Campylobacter sp. RM16187]
MIKIFYCLFLSFSLSFATDCMKEFKSIYDDTSEEGLFLIASKLNDMCTKNDKTACKCYSEYIDESKQECQKGSSIKCIIVGTMFMDNEYESSKYAKQACDNNDGSKYSTSGCSIYGSILKSRYYKSKDASIKKDAIFYLKKACKMGNVSSCNFLKELK